MSPASQPESTSEFDLHQLEVIDGEKPAHETYRQPQYGDLFPEEKKDAMLERLQNSQIRSREKVAQRTNKEIAKLLKDTHIPNSAKRFLHEAAQALEDDNHFLAKECIYKAADTSAAESLDLIEYKPFKRVLDFLHDPLVIPQTGASRASKIAEFFDAGVREFVWGRKLPDTRAKIQLSPEQVKARDKQRKEEHAAEVAPESPSHIPEDISEHGEKVSHVFFAKTKRGTGWAIDTARKFFGDRTSSEYAELAKNEDRRGGDLGHAYEKKGEKLPSTFDRWAQENLALELQAKQVSTRLLEIVRGSEEKDSLTGEKPVLGIFDKVREVIKDAPKVANKEQNPYAIDPDQLEQHIKSVQEQVGRNYENLTAALRNLYFAGITEKKDGKERQVVPSLMESLDRNGIYIPELNIEKRTFEGLREIDGTQSQDLALMRESSIVGDILVVEIEGEAPSIVEVLGYYADEDKLELRNLSSQTGETFSIHPHEHDVRQIQKGDFIELTDRNNGSTVTAEIIGEFDVEDKKVPVKIKVSGEEHTYNVSLTDFDIHKIYIGEEMVEGEEGEGTQQSPEGSEEGSGGQTESPHGGENKEGKEAKLVSHLVIPEDVSEYDQFTMVNAAGKEIQVEISNIHGSHASIRNLSGREQRWEANILDKESAVPQDESGNAEDYWTMKDKLCSAESKANALSTDLFDEFSQNEYPRELTKKDKRGRRVPIHTMPDRDSVVHLLEDTRDIDKKPTRMQKASLAELKDLSTDPTEPKKGKHPLSKNIDKLYKRFHSAHTKQKMREILSASTQEFRSDSQGLFAAHRSKIDSDFGKQAFQNALKTERIGFLFRLWKMIELVEKKLLELQRNAKNPQEALAAEHILVLATEKALEKIREGSLDQARRLVQVVTGKTAPEAKGTTNPDKENSRNPGYTFDDAE